MKAGFCGCGLGEMWQSKGAEEAVGRWSARPSALGCRNHRLKTFFLILLLAGLTGTAMGQAGLDTGELPSRPTMALDAFGNVAFLPKVEGRSNACVGSIEELVRLSGEALTNCVEALGYYSANGVGAGKFCWEAASKQATNQGTCFQPLSHATAGIAAGRWILRHHGEVWVEQFGAVGDGRTDDTDAIQDVVNLAKKKTADKIRVIRFRPGKRYSISKPIDFIGPLANGAPSYLSDLTLLGEESRDSGGDGVRIEPTYADGPAFIFQIAKGVKIKGLGFIGKNVIRVTSFGEIPYLKNYIRDEDQRVNRYSPQCALAFDGIKSTVEGTNRYPQPSLAKYYTNITSLGGSARVTIEDCFFEHWVVPITQGLSGAQNGEEFIIRECYIRDCRDGLAFGQSQTRGCHFDRNNLENVGVAINCLDYGPGIGAMPQIGGGNWIYISKMFRANATWEGGGIRGLYGEQIYTLGDFGNANMAAIPVHFDGCHIEFNCLNGLAPNYHLSAPVGSVRFTSCQLGQLNQDHFNPFIFYVRDRSEAQASIVFESCNFYSGYLAKHPAAPYGFPFVTNNKRKLRFQNCSIHGEMVTDSGYASESWAQSRGVWAWPGSIINVADQPFLVSQMDADFPMGKEVRGAFDAASGNRSATLTVSATTALLLKPNDIVRSAGNAVWYAEGTVPHGSAGTYLGMVAAVNGTSVTLTNLPRGVVEALDAKAFSDPRVCRVAKLHDPITGDITAGSTHVGKISLPGAYKKGDRIRGTGIVEGAFILDIEGDTYTISAPATLTVSQNKLYDAVLIPLGATSK